MLWLSKSVVCSRQTFFTHYFFTSVKKYLQHTSHNLPFLLIFKYYDHKATVLVGFTLSQATKALRESRGIALLYFRSLH